MQNPYFLSTSAPVPLARNTVHGGYSAIDEYPVAPAQTPGFSDGSPLTGYPDHEYLYFYDRGGQPIHHPASSSSATVNHATGLSEPENPLPAFTNPYPEDVSSYHQPWSLPSSHGHARLTESAALGPDPLFKSAPYLANAPSSSTPKLPTPSEMAILLGPAGRSGGGRADLSSIIPPTSLALVSSDHMSAPPPEEEFTLARERKHACSMCHKRFDRPSTLRKHLLVHTGEKAFQCKTCGRRFGVASNLNRHVRRCILKPVNSMHSSPAGTNSATTTDSVSPEPNTPSDAAASERARTLSSSPAATERSQTLSNGPVADSRVTYPLRVAQPRAPRSSSSGYKRRRRAPSPSRWIPGSLRGFILEELQNSTSVPLPPVVPSAYSNEEERNSWDENVGVAPYHPRDWHWKPQLPGPGMSAMIFGGKNVGNYGGAGGREQMFGRLLVF